MAACLSPPGGEEACSAEEAWAVVGRVGGGGAEARGREGGVSNTCPAEGVDGAWAGEEGGGWAGLDGSEGVAFVEMSWLFVLTNTSKLELKFCSKSCTTSCSTALMSFIFSGDTSEEGSIRSWKKVYTLASPPPLSPSDTLAPPAPPPFAAAAGVLAVSATGLCAGVRCG